MRLRIEVSVEIFIDQCGLCLSGQCCTITTVHDQMTLWRHIAGKGDTHCLELREAIGDRQWRWLVKLLATRCGDVHSLAPCTSTSGKLVSGTGATVGYALICAIERSSGIGG